MRKLLLAAAVLAAFAHAQEDASQSRAPAPGLQPGTAWDMQYVVPFDAASVRVALTLGTGLSLLDLGSALDRTSRELLGLTLKVVTEPPDEPCAGHVLTLEQAMPGGYASSASTFCWTTPGGGSKTLYGAAMWNVPAQLEEWAPAFLITWRDGRATITDLPFTEADLTRGLTVQVYFSTSSLEGAKAPPAPGAQDLLALPQVRSLLAAP